MEESVAVFVEKMLLDEKEEKQDSLSNVIKTSYTKSCVSNQESGSSDSDGASMHKIKKRIQLLSDSDSDNETVLNNKDKAENDSGHNSSDSNNETSITFKSGLKKSRLHLADNSSDLDSSKNQGKHSIPSTEKIVKNEEQQARMKNKRDKMKRKFKGLLTSRGKTNSQSNSDSDGEKSSECSEQEGLDLNEMSSIASIKKKIKESMANRPSICDPDTSDEENGVNEKHISKSRPKKAQKSTKMIEAKPLRMSAKQAMENMQLIKSESNRMLREKAVSLPYHRPKALSLKDIMARRKPAIAPDGKALPIKMNEQQLQQYALMLEERQKEMMELCKSESDDEETGDKEAKTEENETNVQNNQDFMIESANNDGDIDSNIADNESIKDKPGDIVTKNPNKNDPENINEPVDISVLNDSNFNEIKGSESLDKENNMEDQNDSNTELKLVYNSSIEEENIDNTSLFKENENTNLEQQIPKENSEAESQLILLHYTEKNTDSCEKVNCIQKDSSNDVEAEETLLQKDNSNEEMHDDFFSDDDVDMNAIDKIIENAEIMKDGNENTDSPQLIRDLESLKKKPKILGAPGMVIDLDGTDPFEPRKLSGVELLKERFSYFAKLKTPEEQENEKEKKLKPGTLHLKLKQELEEQIAEQRSLEWAKRLEEEKQQHKEMESILDDDEEEADDSIEKIKSNILNDDGEIQETNEDSENEEEEELIENDIEMRDKPRKKNPLVDEEAEESSCDEGDQEMEQKDNEGDDCDADNEVDGDDDESSSDDTSSDSEEETTKPKKGRILKAFEDSDDETTPTKDEEVKDGEVNIIEGRKEIDNNVLNPTNTQVHSQDEEIQLAQRQKSSSDIFTSQETNIDKENIVSDDVLGTQTFSILESKATGLNVELPLTTQENLDRLSPSQPQLYHDPTLNAIADGLSQNILSSQPVSQSQSQAIGEDILALCTGKFYENQFVSPSEENPVDTISQESFITNEFNYEEDANVETRKEPVNDNLDILSEKQNTEKAETLTIELKQIAKDKIAHDDNLKSILDELDDPAFDEPKPNKFFTGGTQKKSAASDSIIKKRFVIDSDDEANEVINAEKKKKLKKKKPEKRALQISDDEEDEEIRDEELYEDDDMYDLDGDGEKLVEYDSEENEIEVIQQLDNPKKKKRKVADFFENEAELTSEDEWVGSGDEDEHGLDRMEKEEGDDEVFHQGKLRKELGQIHMRDVLDQDKREVRLLQELLFEDGDLGGGHRQRKFRWKNADGDEETGTLPDSLTDTQEEEFDSEEQWRKQRHEREVFLRQMQKQDEEDTSLNISVNRSTIIKANLTSKDMSTVLQEANKSNIEAPNPVPTEKKTTKDVPSPKKSFAIFQQSYHGSLLTRGRGALARLAALAAPLAADDDTPKTGSLAPHKRNFVFTALSQDDDVSKATKRKADVNIGTPKLMKKMKIEDKKNNSKSSLLDHLNK